MTRFSISAVPDALPWLPNKHKRQLELVWIQAQPPQRWARIRGYRPFCGLSPARASQSVVGRAPSTLVIRREQTLTARSSARLQATQQTVTSLKTTPAMPHQCRANVNDFGPALVRHCWLVVDGSQQSCLFALLLLCQPAKCAARYIPRDELVYIRCCYALDSYHALFSCYPIVSCSVYFPEHFDLHVLSYYARYFLVTFYSHIILQFPVESISLL